MMCLIYCWWKVRLLWVEAEDSLKTVVLYVLRLKTRTGRWSLGGWERELLPVSWPYPLQLGLWDARTWFCVPTFVRQSQTGKAATEKSWSCQSQLKSRLAVMMFFVYSSDYPSHILWVLFTLPVWPPRLVGSSWKGVVMGLPLSSSRDWESICWDCCRGSNSDWKIFKRKMSFRTAIWSWGPVTQLSTGRFCCCSGHYSWSINAIKRITGCSYM